MWVNIGKRKASGLCGGFNVDDGFCFCWGGGDGGWGLGVDSFEGKFPVHVEFGVEVDGGFGFAGGHAGGEAAEFEDDFD